MISGKLMKLKHRTIMTALAFVIIGILMVLCPQDVIPIMIRLFSAVILIVAIIGCLEFLDSSRGRMQYILLIGWMLLGIVGVSLMVFEFQSMNILSFLAGIILILNGISGMFFALTYARRSGRNGWWLLVIYGAILVACGVIIILNPWLYIMGNQFTAIGILLIVSSIVMILRFIWLWPAGSR